MPRAAVAGHWVEHRSPGSSGPSSWTPSSLGSTLVGWWRADDLALADGAAVASWGDRTANANTLAQGTAGNRPVYHDGASANAINGKPVVSFASASTQYLTKASPAGLPTTAPMWAVIVMRKTVSTAAFECFLNYGPASGSGGLFWGMNSGANYYNSIGGLWAYPSSSSFSVGGVAASLYQIDGTKVAVAASGLLANYPKSGVQSSGALTSPTSLTLGYYLTGNANPMNGDVAEVIYGGAILTTDQWASIARYIYDRYGITTGTQWNATAALASQPSWNASNNVLEETVLDFANLLGAGGTWNGHRYWVACIPNFDVTAENPSIYYSDDGNTWTAPVGLTNPVVAYPGGGSAGNNADPSLFYNPNDSKLYLVYNVESVTPIGNAGIFIRSSSDGVTWSAATQIITWTVNHQAGEPTIRWDGSKYILVANGSDTGSAPYGLWVWTASSVTGPWSGPAKTAISWNRTGTTSEWYHGGHWLKVGTKWVSLMTDGPGYVNTNMWLWMISTTDFVTFTKANYPTLVPSFGWDSAGFYDASLAISDDGVSLDVWYTGRGTTTWGRTKVPLTEIP